MQSLNLGRSYKILSSCITPRPIAWVVTEGEPGHYNAAPFSLFNFFGGYPPVVCIGMGERPDGGDKDSLRNIRQRREFVVNLVSESLVEAMNLTATAFDSGVSEVEMAGLALRPSRLVATPGIAESPVHLECRLKTIIDMDVSGVMVVANVVGVEVLDEAVLNLERCHLDASKFELVGRMESPGWYTRTTDRFKLKIKAPQEFDGAG